MKLSAGFGLLLVVLIVLGTASYRTIISLDNAANDVVRKATEQELAMEIDLAAMKQSSGTRGFLLTSDEKMLERDAEGKREMKENLDKLTSLVHSDEGKRLFAEVQRTSEAFRAAADREVQFGLEKKTKEALEVMSTQTAPASNALEKANRDFVDHLTKSKETVEKAQDEGAAWGKMLILSLCVAGLVLGLVVALLIARSITVATMRMVAMIQALAANNLTVDDLEIASQDELGKAGTALNQMKNRPALGDPVDRRNRTARGQRQRGTVFHQPADLGQLGRNLRPGQCRQRGHQAGQPESAECLHRLRRDDFHHSKYRRQRP